MSTGMGDLPPKVQLVFYKGYLQALEDLSDQVTDRSCKVEAKIIRLQAAISAVEDNQAVEVLHARS
jgi:hypothetical protein